MRSDPSSPKRPPTNSPVPGGRLLRPGGLVKQLAEQAAEDAAPLRLLLRQRCRCSGRRRVGDLLQRRQRLRQGQRGSGKGGSGRVSRGLRRGTGSGITGQASSARLSMHSAHSALTSGGTTCSCPSTRPMRCEATTTGRPSTSGDMRGQQAAPSRRSLSTLKSTWLRAEAERGEGEGRAGRKEK